MSVIQHSIVTVREALRAIQMDSRFAHLVWENKRQTIRVEVPAGQSRRLVNELKDPLKRVRIPIRIVEVNTLQQPQDDDGFAFG